MERLEEVWRMVRSDETAKLWGMWPAVANAVVHANIVARGIDGFFAPNPDAAWGTHVPLGVERAAFYKTAPLQETLAKLVDFGCLNTHRTRLTLGVVNVRTSEMHYFDSRGMTLDARHVMASGARCRPRFRQSALTAIRTGTAASIPIRRWKSCSTTSRARTR